MAAYEKNKGRSLYDKLIELYIQYGFYKESLVSITKKGMNGAKEIAEMMDQFRKNPFKKIDGIPVKEIRDYQLQKTTNLMDGKEVSIDLPVSNVLQFVLVDNTIISARPSGTEPKIKFYFSVNTTISKKEEFADAEKSLHQKIDRIIADMQL